MRQHDAVIVVATPEMGVNRLISAFAAEECLVWVVLERNDQNDAIAQGIKLSDALKHAVGTRLFPRATPYQSGVAILERYREVLGPLTVAVSGTRFGVTLASLLLAISGPNCRVVLSDDRLVDADLAHLVAAGGEDLLVLDDADLRLSEVEARSVAVETRAAERETRPIARGSLPQGELDHRLKQLGYAYEPYLTWLSGAVGTGLESEPAAAEICATPKPLCQDPELLLDDLLRAGSWRKAAEVAVESVPSRSAEAVLEAAHSFHERGLHEPLWQLLTRLPESEAANESVLFWRLSTAARLGRLAEVARTVEQYLDSHEAPELRALYAGVCPADSDARRREIERAYRARETPFTAYQQGRALSNPADGAQLLKRAVRLAEASDRQYEVTRNAAALTARLIDAGQYADAVRWGEWALAHFDRLELSDAQQRLYVLNNWAYARLLIGESVGLEGRLAEAEQDLSVAFPGLKAQFRSTLGDYLLATERPVEAVNFYRVNYDEAERNMKGIRGLSLVRALLEAGPAESTTALMVANEAFTLTAIDPWEYHRPAVLALGIALALTDPRQAAEKLTRLVEEDPLSLPAPQNVQVKLYLAYCQQKLGNEGRARSTVESCSQVLSELSMTGLRLLTGPAGEFRELWSWCLRDTAPGLELRFLGPREVLADGKELSLGPQLCTILALLVNHCEGIEPGRLLSLLKPEGDDKGTLYSALSKLRKHVPISNPPYRLQVEVAADFVEAVRLLEAGRLRSALELYRGPLLEDCEAPGISELRSAIDETFRQAVLAAKDAEASYTLAQKAHDDLELWEHTVSALGNNDPRALVARARVAELRRDY